MSAKSYLPIGIFDSGLGGLTVLKALCTALPQENFLYLGDTARLPYGIKSPETIQKYLQQNIKYLKSIKVKALVIACNSASSVVDKNLATEMELPIFEVIQPGARSALALTKNNRIGVMGTRATVAGGAYIRALQSLGNAPEVFQQACPLLVPLVEEGWSEDPLTNLVVYRYVSPLVSQNIDTIIMGCTHYPVLKAAIRKAVGPDIHLVDSAQAITQDVIKALESKQIEKNPAGKKGRLHIMTTDHNEGFQAIAERVLAPVSYDLMEQVDLVF